MRDFKLWQPTVYLKQTSTAYDWGLISDIPTLIADLDGGGAYTLLDEKLPISLMIDSQPISELIARGATAQQGFETTIELVLKMEDEDSLATYRTAYANKEVSLIAFSKATGNAIAVCFFFPSFATNGKATELQTITIRGKKKHGTYSDLIQEKLFLTEPA